MENVKSGVIVEESMGNHRPYRLWSADKYRCPVCLKSVVVGFAPKPFVEHFEESYTVRRNALQNELQENFFSEAL